MYLACCPRSAGCNLLHSSILAGDEETALWLLEQDKIKTLLRGEADHPVFGRTPLHYAVSADFRLLVKQMIDLGAPLDGVDAGGNTVMHQGSLGYSSVLSVLAATFFIVMSCSHGKKVVVW